MVNCSAYGCTNRSTVHPELSFHKLSIDEKQNSSAALASQYPS